MRHITTSLLTVALLAGCASSPESVTVEKKNGVTLVHHRQRVGDGAVDRIEAINAKGVVTTAEVHIYDIGRYVDSSGSIHEAHRLYRTVQSERPNLMLPKTVSAGPRTVYTPPNYVPAPQDQRISDAVAEAKAAKEKLDDARQNIEKRLAEDNNLRGQLDEIQTQNAALQAQLDAAMATPARQRQAPETDAQKAAESATNVDALTAWGKQVQQ
jgi:hypothetical protein